MTAPQTLRLPAFALESGATLPGVDVAYRTWGRLAASADNAVLVCHALTGSAELDGWWPDLLGPGRAFDPTRDFVICSNVLGGGSGTSGPASPHPDDGRRWGSRFPAITIRDMVAVQRALIERLGVRRLALVAGGSLGGMQALEWAATHPDLVDAVAVLAAPAAHSAWALALDAAQRAAIAADPRWLGGDFAPADAPVAGLRAARQLAMCTYRSPGSLAGRFGRESEAGRFAVEAWLDAHGERLVRRFDAGVYVGLTRAMDSHDLGRGRGSRSEALSRLTPRALVIAIDSDLLYPLDDVAELAAGLPNASFRTLRSPHGHDAFLIESAQVDALLREFRAESGERPAREVPGVEARPAAVSRVLKFGGSSVGSPRALANLASIAARRATAGPLWVVASACDGVTDQLSEAYSAAVNGRDGGALGSRLRLRHQALARRAAPLALAEIEPALAAVLAELAATLAGIAGARRGTRAERDRVLAVGERLSLPIVAAVLRAAGLAALAIDAAEVIATDGAHGQAEPDLRALGQRVREVSARADVVVTSGFLGRGPDGAVTTLGRGGSDWSAALIAEALGAGLLEIWTDVDGVSNADPRRHPGARLLPRLDYDAAERLARGGARVLHPRSLEPVRRARIPLRVANTFHPERAGTWIGVGAGDALGAA